MAEAEATTIEVLVPSVHPVAVAVAVDVDVDDIAMNRDDDMDHEEDEDDAVAAASDVVASILESNTGAKSVGKFRSYGGDDDDDDDDDDEDGGGGAPKRVLMHYKDMRTYQTVEFHDRMSTKYSFEDGKYRFVAFVPFAEREKSNIRRPHCSSFLMVQ